MSRNVNKSVYFEWMFLELIQIRDECMVRIGGQSKKYGAVLQETINLKRLNFTMISWWDQDESKMEFAPLPLEKQIKGVNQKWLNWSVALFQVVAPHLHKTYHQQQISVAPWSISTTRSIDEKRITGHSWLSIHPGAITHWKIWHNSFK